MMVTLRAEYVAKWHPLHGLWSPTSSSSSSSSSDGEGKGDEEKDEEGDAESVETP